MLWLARFACFYLIVLLGVGAGTSVAADTREVRARLSELQRQAKYNEAIQLAEQHLVTLQSAFGKNHPEVGRMLNRKAEMHRLGGEAAPAATIYRRVLEGFDHLAPNDRDIIRAALANLTLIHMSRGDFALAEKYTRWMDREVQRAAVAATPGNSATAPSSEDGAPPPEALPPPEQTPSSEQQTATSSQPSPGKPPKPPLREPGVAPPEPPNVAAKEPAEDRAKEQKPTATAPREPNKPEVALASPGRRSTA